MMKVIQIQMMMKKLKIIMKLKLKVHYNNTRILVSKKIVKQILDQKMKIVKVKVKVNPKSLNPKIYQITKLIQIQTKQMPMKIQL